MSTKKDLATQAPANDSRSEQPLKKGCVRSCGCSVTRFSDFPTAILLSKIATYGSLTFEPSKKTKGGNAV